MFTKDKKTVVQFLKKATHRLIYYFYLGIFVLLLFFPICVAHFIYEWKIKSIKGLCYLGETSLLLTHPLVNCDSLGYSYMGPPFPFDTSVVWLVSVCQASVDLITSPRLLL